MSKPISAEEKEYDDGKRREVLSLFPPLGFSVETEGNATRFFIVSDCNERFAVINVVKKRSDKSYVLFDREEHGFPRKLFDDAKRVNYNKSLLIVHERDSGKTYYGWLPKLRDYLRFELSEKMEKRAEGKNPGMVFCAKSALKEFDGDLEKVLRDFEYFPIR